jgi:endonuclease YncB( thermonuclease family)
MLILVTAMADPISAQSATPSGIPAKTELATVHRVETGDKVFIKRSDGVMSLVLLAGVDAPEIGECHFAESKDYLTDLLPKGTEVYLEQSGSVDNDANLVVRYVWLPGKGDGEAILVNTKIVRDGFAGFDGSRDTPKYFERIRTAEATARDANKGLWSVCGAVHADRPPVAFTADEQEYLDWLNGEILIIQAANDEIAELTTNVSSLDLVDPVWNERVFAVIETWDTAYWNAEEKLPPLPLARLHQLWKDITWHYDQAGQHLASGLETRSLVSIQAVGDEIYLAADSMEDFMEEMDRILEKHNMT